MWKTEHKGTHASLLSELTSSTTEEERTCKKESKKPFWSPNADSPLFNIIKYNNGNTKKSQFNYGKLNGK